VIKNKKVCGKFEIKLQKKTHVDVERNFKIVESLYHEARTLGRFPPDNILEDLGIYVKMAKVVNSV